MAEKCLSHPCCIPNKYCHESYISATEPKFLTGYIYFPVQSVWIRKTVESCFIGFSLYIHNSLCHMDIHDIILGLLIGNQPYFNNFELME